MPVIATLFTKLDRNSRAPDAYSVDIFEDPGDLPAVPQGALGARGPVQNNVSLKEGLFHDRRAALRALLDAIGTPCQIVEIGEPNDRPHYRVAGLREHVKAPDPRCTVSTVAKLTPQGSWTA